MTTEDDETTKWYLPEGVAETLTYRPRTRKVNVRFADGSEAVVDVQWPEEARRVYHVKA